MNATHGHHVDPAMTGGSGEASVALLWWFSIAREREVMKRQIFILLAVLLILLCHSMAHSSQWSFLLGGARDEAYSLQQTVDGGFIVAGDTYSYGAGASDVYVLKLNADGTVAWQKTYGGDYIDLAYSIQQTADGGYIVAGEATSLVRGTDAWVLKLNANGTVAWQKVYGGVYGDVARSIQQTGVGGYIMAGQTSSFGVGPSVVWVLKLNADGFVAWQKTHSRSGSLMNPSYDFASSVQQTADGGYVIVGRTYFSNVNHDYDVSVLKLNEDGSVAWEKTYGGSDNDFAWSIQQTADGGYIVAGFTFSFGAGSDDAWILKLNSDGSAAWQKAYGGASVDRANSVQQTADGGYIVAGFTQSFGAGRNDAWVVKLNANGTVAWQKTYGGVFNDEAYSVRQTSDGGYIVAGSTESYGVGGSDVWILKLDQNAGISGCSAGAPTDVVPMDSSAIVTSPDVSIGPSIVSDMPTTATVLDTTVTPVTVCSANYDDFMLRVFIDGRGTGRVTSDPSRMDCTNNCIGFFLSDSTVTLTATPDPGASLISWSVACDAGGQVTMDADKTCVATFTTPADFSGTPVFGSLPLLVNFTDLSLNSPMFWLWDFGDRGSASISSPSHVYRRPGLYTVLLTTTGVAGPALARKVGYVTVGPCAQGPVRVAGPAYFTSVGSAYGVIVSSGTIEIQAMEFAETVNLMESKTVLLTGGYTCDYGTRIGDSLIRGSLMIGGTADQ